MLIIFARLAAGEAMPALERLPRRLPRPVRALARAALAITRLLGRFLLGCGRLGWQAARGIVMVAAKAPTRLGHVAPGHAQTGGQP
jgi:hypothetical protein